MNDKLYRHSDIVKAFTDGVLVPMNEEEDIAFKKGISDILNDIPAVEPKVDKDYLIELIQGAVYDGEDCARLMDMVEPKRGRWKKETKHHKDAEQEFYYYDIRCSECGNKPEKSWHLTNFCPNCGARMKGADDE